MNSMTPVPGDNPALSADCSDASNAVCGDSICPGFETCDSGAANSDSGAYAAPPDRDMRGPSCVKDWCLALWDTSNVMTATPLPMTRARACVLAVCGDGIVRSDILNPNHPLYEACDDANTESGDSCTNNCKAARCGDEIVRTDKVEEKPVTKFCDGTADCPTDCSDQGIHLRRWYYLGQ